MSTTEYRAGTLLQCGHQALAGAWPGGVSFVVAPDASSRFPSPVWRFHWADAALQLATSARTDQLVDALCLWATGVDERFWLASDLPSTFQGSQAVVARSTGAASALSIGAVTLTSLRVSVAAKGASSVQITPYGGAACDVPVSATGSVDLTAWGPGLYRIGSEQAWVYASPSAVRQRPALVVVLSAREVAEALARAGTPRELSVPARSTYWRYFVFAPAAQWQGAEAWAVESSAPDTAFVRVTVRRDGDPFRVQHASGTSWLEFPGGQRALGFMSRAPVAYLARPSVRLTFGVRGQSLPLPAPALTAVTLARASSGAQPTLCADAFIHL